MTNWIEKLKILRQRQKDLLDTLDSTVREADQDNILSELESLRNTLKEREKLLKDLKDKYQKAEKENQNLRITLREQILDEKLNILKISREKLNIYFHTEKNKSWNSLFELEDTFQNKIKSLRNEAAKQLGDERDAFDLEIEKLYRKMTEKIKALREKEAQKEKDFLNTLKEGMDTLGNEPMDEKTMQMRIKQNKIEMKIGLNWINKIGIVLILIGIGFTATMTYQYINNYAKGILFFVLGILFLGGGEFFHRKSRDIFSKSLIGGGVAILYASVFYSYFSLQIIDMNIGLILSVIITLTILALSIRYNSKTVVSLGLVGGYLPFLTFAIVYGLKDQAIYIGMGYLFFLNLSVLALSFWKRWNISNYISFLLNIPAMVYLVFNCHNTYAAIAYAFITFLLYLIAVLCYPFRTKSGLTIPDTILLGLNTTISAGVIYGLFEHAGITNCRGILALIFTLIYIGLGTFVSRVMKEERKTVTLFYITALTFSVLMIPFQFGIDWLSIGWLIEAVLLIVFGHKREYGFWEKMGWFIFGLCLVSFYIIDWLVIGIDNNAGFFAAKYLFVTAGQILVFTVYQRDIIRQKLSEYSGKGKYIRYFKYLVLLNFYAFLCYNSIHYYNILVSKNLSVLSNIAEYFSWVIIAGVSMFYGFAISKIKAISDKITRGFHVVLSIIADFILIYLISCKAVLINYNDTSLTLRIIAFILLVGFNVLTVLNIRELIIRFLKYNNKSMEFYPLWIGILLLGNITAYLIVQFNLGNWNLILSFAYLFLAIGCILYGFWRKYLYIRLYGLGLTIFSLGKLLIFDLNNLDIIGKTIAYFGFGLLLIAISFIYQKVNNAVNGKAKGEVEND